MRLFHINDMDRLLVSLVLINLERIRESPDFASRTRRHPLNNHHEPRVGQPPYSYTATASCNRSWSRQQGTLVLWVECMLFTPVRSSALYATVRGDVALLWSTSKDLNSLPAHHA